MHLGKTTKSTLRCGTVMWFLVFRSCVDLQEKPSKKSKSNGEEISNRLVVFFSFERHGLI